MSRKFIYGTALHGETDTVKHKPSGLLSDTQSPTQLARANPVLGVHNHPKSREPFIKSKCAILKNRSRFGGKLLFAIAAFPAAASGAERSIIGFATRTGCLAVGPANRNHKCQSAVSVGEVFDGLGQRLRKLNCVFHAPEFAQNLW
jgi:hypothetical protein